MLRRILLPIDGSEGSQHAARFAAELAAATGAIIVTLHVVHPSSAEAIGMASLPVDELQATLKRTAAPYFARVATAMGPVAEPLVLTEVVEMGDPAVRIIATARSQDADLIVMGSRGLTQFQELMLGSVSAKVVHHAHCPVTVVR